jgi:hypothetical protein
MRNSSRFIAAILLGALPISAFALIGPKSYCDGSFLSNLEKFERQRVPIQSQLAFNASYTDKALNNFYRSRDSYVRSDRSTVRSITSTLRSKERSWDKSMTGQELDARNRRNAAYDEAYNLLQTRKDQSNQAFRDVQTRALDARAVAMNAASDAHYRALDVVFSQMHRDCGAGMDPSQAYRNYQASAKQALRDFINASFDARNVYVDTIEPGRDAFVSAERAAEGEYRDALERADLDYINAFYQ